VIVASEACTCNIPVIISIISIYQVSVSKVHYRYKGIEGECLCRFYST